MLGRCLARYQPEWLERLRLGAPLRLCGTGKIALALNGRWRAESLFVQLVTKIDEAGTHGPSPYMVMAGYTARLGQWNRFDLKWRKGLRKAGLDYFHVKEHGDHPFSSKAVKIADSNVMFGFVTRLDRADYEQHYRNGGWGGKAQPDSMYGLCFRYCLSLVVQIALQEMAREGLVLNFIVEDGHPNSGAPTEIVRRLKRDRITGLSEYLGYATPGEKMKVYGLQAADGLATGSWHREAEGSLSLAPPQPPRLVPRHVTGRSMRAPVFRCHIDGSELAKFKDGYFAHIAHRVAYGRAKYNKNAAAIAVPAADES